MLVTGPRGSGKTALAASVALQVRSLKPASRLTLLICASQTVVIFPDFICHSLASPSRGWCTETDFRTLLVLPQSGVPLMRMVSASNLVSSDEAARVAALERAFDEAYKSPTSIVVIDGDKIHPSRESTRI